MWGALCRYGVSLRSCTIREGPEGLGGRPAEPLSSQGRQKLEAKGEGWPKVTPRGPGGGTPVQALSLAPRSLLFLVCLLPAPSPPPVSLVPLIEVLRRNDSVPVGLVCDRATAVSSAAVRVWTVAKRANLTSSHHTHAAGNYTCGGDAFGTYSACCLNVPSHLSSGRRGLEGARTVLRGREEANRREAGRADLRL